MTDRLPCPRCLGAIMVAHPIPGHRPYLCPRCLGVGTIPKETPRDRPDH